MHASLVLTDSGGVQEETTCGGTPCLITRPVAERPAPITRGANRLVSSRPVELVTAEQEVLAATASGHMMTPRPARWDGRAAERLVAALSQSTGKSVGKRY